jgi:hypothetical protein
VARAGVPESNLSQARRSSKIKFVVLEELLPTNVRFLALSGQSDRTRVCPLLDQSGQSRFFRQNGLSATQSGHATRDNQARGELSCGFAIASCLNRRA